MGKDLVKQSLPSVETMTVPPKDSYLFGKVEAVVNKYYESKGSKTPLLIERSDLLKYIAENI